MSKDVVGVDAGGTLAKIVYTSGRDWGYKTFPTYKMEEINSWIDESFNDPEIHITGGKAAFFIKSLALPAKRMNEFEATCAGVRWLLKEKGLIKKTGDHFIVANVGTGTSLHYVYDDDYERIGGSGIGGGTLVGLSYLLTGVADYDTIIQLAQKGSGRTLNIKVGDIYSHEPPPIPGDLTASNFGNVTFMKKADLPKEDCIAAVVRMIGETITTMSVQAADRLQTESIIYIGSTFASNIPLQDIIKEYTELRGKKAYFLDNGEFSGAIGAVLHNREHDHFL
ncbi:type II pantothenate kinase [Bacillus piscicola]|uniref:type II pantothenate kinase n=1 Tax=Bacillus piscicola TaxID=1632684 RepID=UPI001F099841|nr:type II pantothenate kinase [Bacillus piscicola]